MNDGTDLVGFGDLARTLLRWGWLIIAATVGGIALATVLVNQPDSVSTTARIGLTDQVVWPFFNSTRQRVLGLSDQLDATVVADEFADDLISLDVSLPPGETFINVDVLARSAEAAVAIADRYAMRLVELDTPEVVSGPETALADANATIVELTQAIAVHDTTYDQLLEAQAEAERLWIQVRNEGQPTAVLAETLVARNQAEAATAAARAERDRLSRRLASIEVERDQMELNMLAAPGGPEVTIIRSAVADPLASTPLRARQIIGGLVGAVVAALAALILDRQFGRVRTPQAVRALTGLPVVDGTSERGAGRVAGWIERQPTDGTIGFIGGRHAESIPSSLSPQFTAPTRIVMAGEPILRPEATGEAWQLVALGDANNGIWFDRAMDACDPIVLVVPRNRFRPATIRRMLTEVAGAGRTVDVVAFVNPPSRRRTAAAPVRRSPGVART